MDPRGAYFGCSRGWNAFSKDILRGWLVSTGVIDITHAPYGVQIPGWKPAFNSFSTCIQTQRSPQFPSVVLAPSFSSAVVINRSCYRFRADKASLIVEDRSIPWLSQRGTWWLFDHNSYAFITRVIKIVPLNSSEYRHGKFEACINIHRYCIVRNKCAMVLSMVWIDSLPEEKLIKRWIISRLINQSLRGNDLPFGNERKRVF